MNKRILWSLAAATMLVAGSIWTASVVAGNSMGPGMMYNNSASTQTAPGGQYYGMGAGMMGNSSMGSGMMGNCGMGPGMMGGYGMSCGIMGGYGMGRHMMGGYGAFVRGLNAEQRNKIAGIRNEAMNKAWPIMGQLRNQYFQFAQLMKAENPDRAAINKVYARISDLQKQLLDLRLATRQQMMKVLTADQRKELLQGGNRRGW